MDKLEQYLDQVCRGIGGPLEMRRHVRQELREHLLDAVAQHKAAGMAEAAALDKALEEFGKPEEVRSELEAAHGQRMTWIIDKAMQWKEMTMKAKWLWTTWAHLALMGVIALEALFITFNMLMIFPKFQKLLHDGIIDQGILDDHETWWMNNFLHNLNYVGKNHTTWLALGAAVAWGLFEWRVKSEHKTFMRLSALGTAAVALMIVIILMAGSLVVLFCMGVPAMGVMARPWAVERVDSIDKSVNSLEQALAKKDWPDMQKHADEASGAARLLLYGPAVTSLIPNDSVKAEEIRGSARGLRRILQDAQLAIREHDEKRLEAALQDFRKAFEPVRAAAKKPAVK